MLHPFYQTYVDLFQQKWLVIIPENWWYILTSWFEFSSYNWIRLSLFEYFIWSATLQSPSLKCIQYSKLANGTQYISLYIFHVCLTNESIVFPHCYHIFQLVNIRRLPQIYIQHKHFDIHSLPIEVSLVNACVQDNNLAYNFIKHSFRRLNWLQ